MKKHYPLRNDLALTFLLIVSLLIKGVLIIKDWILSYALSIFAGVKTSMLVFYVSTSYISTNFIGYNQKKIYFLQYE